MWTNMCISTTSNCAYQWRQVFVQLRQLAQGVKRITRGHLKMIESGEGKSLHYKTVGGYRLVKWYRLTEVDEKHTIKELKAILRGQPAENSALKMIRRERDALIRSICRLDELVSMHMNQSVAWPVAHHAGLVSFTNLAASQVRPLSSEWEFRLQGELRSNLRAPLGDGKEGHAFSLLNLATNAKLLTAHPA